MITPGVIFSSTSLALILISSPSICDSAEGNFYSKKEGPTLTTHIKASESMEQHGNFTLIFFYGLSLDLADLVDSLPYIFPIECVSKAERLLLRS